jgi:hypothetical protein
MVEAQTIEQYVKESIDQMHTTGQTPVAVMLGHEDWLNFTVQSKVSYTPFGSARRYQPALGGLLLVRIDEMQAVRVVTQQELDTYAATHQIL